MTVADHCRRLARLVRFGFAVGLAAADFTWVRAHRRDAAARSRWLQHHCRRALRVLGVEVVAQGTPPAQEFVVCNHVGYLDILVLASQVPLVFVAKREVASWPVWGRLARAAGTVFVDRTRRGDVARVGQEIGALLASGSSVALFPEGTSTDGRRVLPFKSALLAPVAASHHRVTPAVIAYAVPAPFHAAEHVAWWGEMTLLPHLWQLLAIPSIEAHLAWEPPRPAAADRKHLARELQHVVAARLPALPRAHTSRRLTPIDDRRARPGEPQVVSQQRAD